MELDFIIGNILRKREKHIAAVIKKYDKAGKNHDQISDEEMLSKAERNIIKILADVNRENLKSNYMQNLLLIASKFVLITKKIPDDIVNILMNDDETVDVLKIGLLWGKALQMLE